jgi:hypothetical protein
MNEQMNHERLWDPRGVELDKGASPFPPTLEGLVYGRLMVLKDFSAAKPRWPEVSPTVLGAQPSCPRQIPELSPLQQIQGPKTSVLCQGQEIIRGSDVGILETSQLSEASQEIGPSLA